MRWSLAFGGLLSLCGPVLARKWIPDSSCKKKRYVNDPTEEGVYTSDLSSNGFDIVYATKVAAGVDDAFTWALQMHDAWEKIADNKTLRHEDNITSIVQWALLEKDEKLSDKTDLGALRWRLEEISAVVIHGHIDPSVQSHASTTLTVRGCDCDARTYHNNYRAPHFTSSASR
ncbi:hypothetical protein N7492_007858 [Penicillium capsulatum]|uniref:Uncharacterized protein n=1 Tax=Penicillium capsulatum TaxID=69766 RepID=A0A9W9LMJ1_9EURO|nr:hypothetical protein N7492_007858 [Penicillium capsulatum]KAJ6117689.1 hypothetical protein N7512_007414 [Penicillium capsulatum]